MRSGRTSVLVCRGCCCGTERKHPEVDHAAHLATLRAALPTGRSTKLWTVDCLGPCDHSNVVVVRSDGSRRWFGDMLADADVKVLADWVAGGATGRPPATLSEHEFVVPHEPAIVSARLSQLTPGQLSDLVFGLLCDQVGTWTMGVHGAVSLFDPTGAVTTRTSAGRVIEAVTTDAAVRLNIEDDTRGFVVEPTERGASPVALILATIDRRPAPRHSITELGQDGDAIGSADRGSMLFDLGIGREVAAFCVRATDDSAEILRSQRGRNIGEVFGLLAAPWVERSPHRVVISGLGRIEITGPTPAPGLASLTGSHTHFLPGELEMGRDLPPGLTLPAGFQPAVIFYPPTVQAGSDVLNAAIDRCAAGLGPSRNDWPR